MNRRLRVGSPAAGAGSGTASPAAVSQPALRLIAVMLIAAAALDLIRCGLVMVAVRHPASAAGLVMIGLAAAALSVRTARGCRGRQRWAVWAALLIGAASAPQAAVSGFSSPYTIPDTATAVLGVVLAVAVLATIGRTGGAGGRQHPEPLRDNRGLSDDPRYSGPPPVHEAARVCQRKDSVSLSVGRAGRAGSG
jgi:hypothetical protein